jgi:hypothetical protein
VDGPSSHTVRARIIDKDGGFTEYTTTVVVTNVNPAVIAPSNQSANEGTSTSFALGSFSDPGTADNPWAVDVDWGDGSGHTTFNLANQGSLGNASHTYPDGPASKTVTVKVTDKDGGFDTKSFTVTVDNVNPTGSLGNNGPVNEGSTVTVSFSGQSDPSGPDATAGFHYAFSCTNGSLASATYATSGTASSTTCTYSDNGSKTVRARIIDKNDGLTEYTTTVVVSNVAPSVIITGPPSGSIYPVGTTVTFTGSFTDAGSSDTHSAQWAADSTTFAGSVTEAGGNGTVTGSRTFTTPGVYNISLTVTDDDGGATTATTVGGPNGLPARIIVYDPNAGFVTGGGYINHAATGMIPAGPSMVDKANYGFNAKYKKGSSTPDGEVEFQLKPANINFHSTSLDWLIVNTTATRAQLQGSGTVNGAGSYGFLLTVTDGGSSDTFRIRIWDKGTGTVVYDNEPGRLDSTDPITPAAGGNIVVHK